MLMYFKQYVAAHSFRRVVPEMNWLHLERTGQLYAFLMVPSNRVGLRSFKVLRVTTLKQISFHVCGILFMDFRSCQILVQVRIILINNVVINCQCLKRIFYKLYLSVLIKLTRNDNNDMQKVTS
jgi:hypothetical protein